MSHIPISDNGPSHVPMADNGPCHVPMADNGPSHVPVVDNGPSHVPVVDNGTSHVPVVDNGPAYLCFLLLHIQFLLLWSCLGLECSRMVLRWFRKGWTGFVWAETLSGGRDTVGCRRHCRV